MSPMNSHESSYWRRDSSMAFSIRKVSATLAWPQIHGDRKSATITDVPRFSSGMLSETDSHRAQSSLSYSRGPSSHKRSEAVDLREPAPRSKRPPPASEDGDTISELKHSCLFCDEPGAQDLSPMPSLTDTSSILSTSSSVVTLPPTRSRRRSSTMDLRDVLHNAPLPAFAKDTSHMHYSSSASAIFSSTPHHVTPLSSNPITHITSSSTAPFPHRPRRNSSLPEIKRQAFLSVSTARLAPSGLVPNRDLDSWSRLWDEAYEHKDEKAPKRRAHFRSAIKWKHSKSDLKAHAKKSEEKQHSKSDLKAHAKKAEGIEKRAPEERLWEQARQRRAALDYQVLHKCGNSSGVSPSISGAPSSIASSQPVPTLSRALLSPPISEDENMEECSCDTSSVLYGQEGKLGSMRRKGFVEKWVLGIKEACCQDDGSGTPTGEDQAPHPIHHV